MKRALLTVAALVAAAVLVPAAGARSQRLYYCTETIHRGNLGFGVIFFGTNHTRLMQGCRVFAHGGFRIYWKEYQPAGWVIAAEYVNPTVKMDALLLAPKTARSLIFNAVNKTIFIDAGWILIRR